MPRHFFSTAISRHPVALASVVLFLFSFGIYSSALNHGFVWDDEGVIVKEQKIRDLSNIPSFFTTPLILGENDTKDTLIDGAVRYYRPLMSSLHAIEYKFLGDHPFGYKIINLLLNGTVVICSFLLVRALTGKTLLAFFAALLFAANPARGEVVYWVYSDAHMFGAFFLLFALLAYHYGRTFLSISGLAVGLLCLESVVLFPLALLVYHLTITYKHDRQWLRLAPFVALVVLYLVCREQIAGAVPIADLSLLERFRAIAFLSVKHLQVFFVTDAPVTMYRYSPGMFTAQGVVTEGYYLLFALFFVLGVCLWWLRREWFFWFAWFFIFILPSFNTGGYTDYLMAEKTLYLASLGPCVLIAASVLSLGSQRCVVWALLLFLIGYLASKTVERGQYWTDTSTYLEKLLEFEPDYHVAQYQLGVEYLRLKRYEDALHQFDVFLEFRPGWRQRITELQASVNEQWGKSLAEQGDLGGALTRLHRAQQLLPGKSEVYNNLGTVYHLRGERSKAIENWQIALRLDPENVEARINLKMFSETGGAN